MKIKISKEISLPADVVTQTIAILAKRRAGKSYTMRKLVEQLLTNDQQVILVDPKGDQWGIRSSADGKNPGYPIVILGGEHGDAPLEVNAGEVVAKLVVEERVSVLLDLSTFRKHEIATFMTMFLENLYRLKAQEAYRTPVMLVIDEADAIAPQKPQKGEERMLGAAEDIVRRGGQRGIGCALITQRSAVLNKNVLTQAQMLIVLRTIAPQDLSAMKAWIEVHGTLEEGKQLMDSLPSLPIGDAWFWSPGWPTDQGIFQRSHILPIETFDSGATPKPGQKKVIPKNLADVDLNALKKQMSATIEKAKSDDPKLLKQKIIALEKIIGLTKNPLPAITKWSEGVLKEKIDQALIVNDRKWQGEFDKQGVAHTKEINEMVKLFQQIKKIIDPVCADGLSVWSSRKEFFKIDQNIMKDLKYHIAVDPAEPGGDKTVKNLIKIENPGNIMKSDLTGPEQRILNAIAWLESIGVPEPEQPAVSFLAGYTYGGGGFNNPKGMLRTKGMVEYISGNKIKLTDTGRENALMPVTTPTNEEMHQKVLDILPGPEKRLLSVLIEAYPNKISGQELAEKSGYVYGSGGFNNPKGKLRTLGLIEYHSGGMVSARDILFPE